MTTYNTGNPIGSKGPRDLYDNAENLDEAVNTRQAESWNDRFGVARKTWWGMEQDFQQFLIDSGYVNIGDYGPGLEITARNQIFWRDGELYRAGANLELPYTTTGDWGAEEGLFVAVGDQSLRQQLVGPDGAFFVGYESTTVGELIKTLINFTTPEAHGAIGDGATDDTLALLSAFATGKYVLCREGATYIATSEIDVHGHVNLNGSHIKFQLVGGQRGLLPMDYSIIENGKITVEGSSFPVSGEWMCPILIGKYSVNEDYHNITLRNLIIDSNCPDGNGIFVTGNSSSIVIENIYFPDNNVIGRPIMLHWGPVDDDPLVGSRHPNNVTIRNIKAGKITSTASFAAIVFLSAAYDVSIDCVSAEEVALQWGILGVFAGDYGGIRATENQADLVMKNIRASNLSCPIVHNRALTIRCRSTLDDNNVTYQGPHVENITAIGLGDTPLINIAGVLDGYLVNPYLKGGSTGIGFERDVAKFNVLGGTVSESRLNGISIASVDSTFVERVTVKGVNLISNGMDMTANYAAITVGNNARNNVIDSCYIEGNQQMYGIRLTNASTGSVIKNCFVQSHRTGGSSYSLGATNTYEVIRLFENNESNLGTNYQSGVDYVPVRILSKGDKIMREFVGTGAPSNSAFSARVGDRVLMDTPSAGGMSGAMCITAGNPGVWKPYGRLDA